MAWTEKRPSGKYAGRYRDGAGRAHTVNGGPFVHKARALRAAATAEDSARKASWVNPRAGERRWGDWVEEWWPTRSVEPSTLRNDRHRLDTHLMSRWGDVPLDRITRHDVKAWAVELRESGRIDRRGPTARARDAAAGKTFTRQLGVSTVQKCVFLLSSSLQAAVDAEILERNVAYKIAVAGRGKTIDRYLTRDEFDRIVYYLDANSAALATVLAFTGMRIGEAVIRRPDDVDMQRRRIRVHSSWDFGAKREKDYPKNGRRRFVPMTQRVLEVLDMNAGTLLHWNSAVWRSDAFSWRWEQAVKLAGIEPARVHDLRHTCASWLIQGGVPLAEVGQVLGHTSPQTTQRYAHLAEEPSQAVWDALN